MSGAKLTFFSTTLLVIRSILLPHTQMKRILTLAAPAVALPTLIATLVSTTTCDQCVAPTSFAYTNSSIVATLEPVPVITPSSSLASVAEPDTTEYDIYELTETVCRGLVCDLTTNIYSKLTVVTTIGGALTLYITGVLQTPLSLSLVATPWANDTTITTTIGNEVTVITTTRGPDEAVEVTLYVTEEDVYTEDVVETEVQETVVMVTQCGANGCSEVQQTTSTTKLSTHPETKTKTTTKAVENTETTTTQLSQGIVEATLYVTEGETATVNVVDTVVGESIVYTTVCGPTGCIVVGKTSTLTEPTTTTAITTTTAPPAEVEATLIVTEVDEDTVHHIATDVSEHVVIVSQPKPDTVDEVTETNIKTTVVVITLCADDKCHEVTITTTSSCLPVEPTTTTTVCQTCDAVSVPEATTEPVPVPTTVPTTEPTAEPTTEAEPSTEPEPTTEPVPTVAAQSAPPSLSIVNVIENNISTQELPTVASQSSKPTTGSIPTFDGGAGSLTASGVLGVLVGLAMLM